jgi:IS5 family transposase
MRQTTFASQSSFEKFGRKSKREQFAETMEVVVPWAELLSLIEPYYPKAGNGRQPVGLSIMLRVYFLQQWFNLSDPGVEDALYESPVLRRFAGVDLGRAAAPDETTVLRFRHLLEEHDLCGRILDEVNGYLDGKGLRISTGTIVDATIIAAPSSTKNSQGERDAEMHQTKKGNQLSDVKLSFRSNFMIVARQSMAFWRQGAYRCRQQGMHRPFSVHHGSFGFRRAHASRLASW